MKQKIIKIGSSIGVVIPKSIAEERGFRAGGTATLTMEADSNAIRINPTETPVSIENKDVVQALTRATAYIEKYRKDFEALADK